MIENFPFNKLINNNNNKYYKIQSKLFIRDLSTNILSLAITLKMIFLSEQTLVYKMFVIINKREKQLSQFQKK